MGNQCCKVNNYIDEEEEFKNPFEIREEIFLKNPKKLIIEKKPPSIHFEAIIEDTPLEGQDIEPLDNNIKEYSQNECLIQNNDNLSLEDIVNKSIEYVSTQEPSFSNSIDIISQSSIISVE